jgi:protein subunit release factor A
LDGDVKNWDLYGVVNGNLDELIEALKLLDQTEQLKAQAQANV